MATLDHAPAARDPVPHAAWWSGSVAEFRSISTEVVVEVLTKRLVEAHFTARADQIPAWRDSITTLKNALQNLAAHSRLLLEYPLIRLGRRLDAVLVTEGAIIILEFKSAKFDRTSEQQVTDYALDLRDFHAASRHHPIVPILVSSKGIPALPAWPLFWVNADNPVFQATTATLARLLPDILSRIDHSGIDIDGWEHAPYRPVPTIIEAADMLYRKHGVQEIRDARADTHNLKLTTNIILQAISSAKADNAYIIIFVTGIPGSGKTLCGLGVAFSTDVAAAFLTGTLPMVYVLRKALGLDASRGGAHSTRTANRTTRAKIQSINHFLKDNSTSRNHPPAEHVIVVDEAQRAWDAPYGQRKFKLDDSEAGIILDIMAQHKDYAVIVGLIGNGQEINTGEAGLAEWGRAITARPQWQVRAAPGVLDTPDARQKLFHMKPETMQIDEHLHLAESVRLIRSSSGANWVDAVLRGQVDEAKLHTQGGAQFFVTRSLDALRRALRSRAGGLRRTGLVCSSGAKRLVADGLWPNFEHQNEDLVANWFLKRWPDDVRASNALEIPATQFACQGLELDYVGLCWGGDFLWNGRWAVRNFKGTKWQDRKARDAIDFCRNTYRVLLTRARYDTIIWVPEGDPADVTRAPAGLNATAAFLRACGAEDLPDVLVVPNVDDTPDLL